MILRKRGVSDVVANVLIILLVVVGVALIWAAVRPAIRDSSEGIKSDCFLVNLNLVKCEVDVTSSSVKVNIARKAGSGDLKAVDLVFEGDVYNSVPSPTGTPPNIQGITSVIRDVSIASSLLELTTKQSSISVFCSGNEPFCSNQLGQVPTNGFFAPRKVNLASVIGTELKVCYPVTQEISCSCKDSDTLSGVCASFGY
jgi:hypothetical protein